MKRWLLALLLLAPLAAVADGTPAEEDWPLPPTAQPQREAIPPQRVYDIKKAAGLLGVTAGRMLPDGRILFWGDAEEVTQRAISTLNPADGQVETLLRSDALHFRIFLLTPDRKALWFSTVEYGKPERLYVLDLATQRIWPMEEIYGDGVALLLDAVKDDTYWQVRMEPDGRLLLEWQRWYSIANWWGKTPADWHMETDARDPVKAPDVSSRAYLPSPVEWLKRHGTAPKLPITLEASFQSLLKHQDNRPKPAITADGRYYAPLHDGMYFSTLHTLPLPGYGLTVQLFNRYRDPRTLQACGLGNDEGNGLWSSVGGVTCARYQGAYVEQTADGKLVHVLNHGVGVPEGVALRGRLFAMSGITEEPSPARYVSLWDAPAGKLLAHLALPEEAVGYAYPYTILFSEDTREIYCVSSYPRPKLYVWQMEPAWRKLAVAHAPIPARPAKTRR